MKKTLHVRIVIEDFDLKFVDGLVNDIETLLKAFDRKRIEINLREPIEFRRKPSER